MLVQSTGASRRFTVTGLFAEGAQSKLYTARDEITEEICLLKTGEAVKQEALLSLELNHPYIARAYDFGTHPEIGVYAAYPKFSESSLREFLKIGSKDFRRVALQIAEVLAFLHHRGWLYHDFKPEHFLVGEDSIKVLDLGLCTKIVESESSNTFSGTFPYISPERLTGRRVDARSDIFGLGMMLLHLFYPDEDWSGEPSLALLQQLQKRSHDLPPGFWKKLIVQMTSLEPSQRPESAAEVWKKLLPQKARGTFLIFPVPAMFSLASEVLEAKERIVVAQSPSQINLDLLNNQVLSLAWNSSISTIMFDVNRTKVEEVFMKLASLYVRDISTRFFSAMESLERLRGTQETIVILHEAESLKSRQRSFLSYALSSLTTGKVVRILLTTSSSCSWLDVGQLTIDIPILTRKTLTKIRQAIVPTVARRVTIKKIERCFTPEQLVARLAEELPRSAKRNPPKLIKSFRHLLGSQKLTKHETQFLVALSLMGGSCDKEIILKALGLSAKQSATVIKSLTLRRYIERQQNKFFLSFQTDRKFEQFAGKLKKRAASALLDQLPEDKKSSRRYRLARVAGKDRLAGYIAIKKARSISPTARSDHRYGWFYKAFSCGANLPRTTLERLLGHCLRQRGMREAKRLFAYVKQHFGFSYKFADLLLEFDDRLNNWRRAQIRAEQLATIAKAKNHTNTSSYFSAKLAKFLIMQQDFERAEKILGDLQHSQISSSQIRGMVCHYAGMSLLFRGQLDEAAYEFLRATKERHQYRASSYMNMGIALGRMGKFEIAKRYVRKSIRIFSYRGDTNHLAYAYNNMGALMVDSGKMAAGLQLLKKSALLSRALKNSYTSISALNNISKIYEVEARPDKAVEFYRKSSRIAVRDGLIVRRWMGLSNYGLQRAMQGEFNHAIRVLMKARLLMKNAGLRIEMGSVDEHLGLTYMFLGKHNMAKRYLHKARSAFTGGGCDVDEMRINLYLALAFCHLRQLKKAADILALCNDFAKGSFELGLRNYVSAYFRLLNGGAARTVWVDELRMAESIFREIRNLFWLAKLCSLKGDFYLQTGELEKADLAFGRAADIFRRFGSRKEVSRLKRKMSLVRNSEHITNAISGSFSYCALTFINTLVAEETMPGMISEILLASLQLTRMDRGLLIIYGSTPYIYKSTDLKEDEIQEILKLSNYATERCIEEGKSYVTSHDLQMKDKSTENQMNTPVSLYLPLKTSEALLGVIYLSGSDCLEVGLGQLAIFSDIVSMSLENLMKSQSARTKMEILGPGQKHAD